MSRKFYQRPLTLPGFDSLPSSIPLILPNNGTYDFNKKELSLQTIESRSTLKVLPEALQLLESIQKPVAVVSICGPCRSGKSYILSRMLGSGNAFALGHTTDSKTFGIWIGTSVLECEEFALVLMDTEGIDSVEAKRKDDISILLLSLMLSSCFIYNSIGLVRNEDLKNVEQLVHNMESIVIKRNMDEDCDITKHFPSFVWLLRDVHLKLVGKDGMEVTPTKYLTENVFRLHTPMNKKEDVAWKKVGQAIMTKFPSVQCVTMQSPSSSTEVMKSIGSNEDELDPQFNKEVQRFIDYVCESVKPKHGYNSSDQINGQVLAEMATQYVKTVNDPETIPCISDMWLATIESVCTKKIETLVKEYDCELEAILSKIEPAIEEGDKDKGDLSTMFGIHCHILQTTTSTLIGAVRHFVIAKDSELTIKALTDALESKIATFVESKIFDPCSGKEIAQQKVVDGVLKKHADKNYKKSLDQCRSVITNLFQSIETKTLQDVDYTAEEYTKDFECLTQTYWKTSVGPAKWEAYTEFQQTIEKNKIMCNSLRESNQKYHQELKRANQLQLENSYAADTIKSLRMEASTLSILHARYEDKLKEVMATNCETIKKLNDEIQSLKEQKICAERESKGLKKQYEVTQNRIDQLSNRLLKHEEEKAAVERELSQLTLQLKSLQEDNATASESNKSLISTIQTLEEEIKTLNQEGNKSHELRVEFEKKMAEKQREHEATIEGLRQRWRTRCSLM